MNTQAPTTRDRKALEQRRMKAARLFERDVPQCKIAERLKVTPAAVCIWHTAWEKDREDGLKSKGPPGFASQYTDEKKRALKKIILQGPSNAGYTTDFWTIDRIRDVAKKKLGIKLGTKRTWMILMELGFSVQKPERRARERNEKAISDWKLITFPKLKKMGASQ
jgi:transposase